VATKVQATMLLHPVLRFKANDEEENRLAIEEQEKAKEQEKLAKEAEQKRLPAVEEGIETETVKSTEEPGNPKEEGVPQEKDKKKKKKKKDILKEKKY